MPNQNPNEAVRPDFTTQEHQEACQQLIEEGLDAEQAARSLAALWTLTNNADKDRWAIEQQRLRKADQRKEDEEEEHRQLLKEEQEALAYDHRHGAKLESGRAQPGPHPGSMRRAVQ
jgi:hypothetical protein